jgi:hypothetical protein
MGKLEEQMMRQQVERAISVPLAKVRTTMQAHWLTGIQCNHEAKTDRPSCFCTVWNGGDHPSIAKALDHWTDHFIEMLTEGK